MDKARNMRHRDLNLSKGTRVVSGRFRRRNRGGRAGRAVGMEKENTWKEGQRWSLRA